MIVSTQTANGVIAHRVDHKQDSSYCDEPQDVHSWDIERLASKGIVECWYWYATGGYEGTGYLLGRTEDGSIVSMYLGHCSCYGPVEDSDASYFSDIASFEQSATAEMLAANAPLLAAMKEPAP